MRHAPVKPLLVSLLLASGLGVASTGWAQTPAAPSSPLPGDKPAPVEQRTERIVVEDAGSRIDELRVGGETRSIVVQPKGGMPAYEVQPASNANTSSGTAGNRVWKILGF